MNKADRKNKRPAGASEPSRPARRLGSADPQKRRKTVVFACWAVLGLLTAVGLIVGMRALQGRVLRKRYQGLHGRAQVRLVRTPQWMPASLAREIAGDLTPPKASLADADLARKVYRRAAANPWVRQVRRVFVRPNTGAPGGLVETDLAFRRPVARIRKETQYVYVDADGYRLPITQVPMWVLTFCDRQGKRVRQVSYLARGEIPAAWRRAAQKIHYVAIDGVATGPPPPGWQWTGEDLAAGLKLVLLVRRRPYHAQITLIDVRNHAGRITRNEPQLRMYAQIGRGRPTDIRFGRFPAPGGGDYVISPQRKLSYLDEYVTAHGGRLAGVNSYLDLRFDELHVSIN